MMTRNLTYEAFEVEIKSYLADQQLINKRFSLRNQARRWSIAPSTLQKLTTGHRRLGRHTAQAIAKYFNVELVDEARPRKKSLEKWDFRQLDAISPLQVGWLSLTMLEMVKLKDFEPSSSWFAARLGIKDETAERVLQQMENEGLINRSLPQWQDQLGDAVVAVDKFITSESIRHSLTELIGMSQKNVIETPYPLREHSFDLFPISEANIPRFKERLSSLRLEFAQTAQNARGVKDQVYAFQIGFFPLTK